MERKEIEQTVNTILEEKFQFHAENLSALQKSESLFKLEIGFKAVDLFVLYMELERVLNIKFDEEDVVKNRFDVYNNVLKSVERHVTS